MTSDVGSRKIYDLSTQQILTTCHLASHLPGGKIWVFTPFLLSYSVMGMVFKWDKVLTGATASVSVLSAGLNHSSLFFSLPNDKMSMK
ncbi:uncharacterized protein BDZ83DRAFT_364301 [Colletotrichum acutatum]|uniref:Uncharacterized protein n=1 Tax=Glomerella acutata TaxID=27357 RepID=A0AAD8UHE9_GLOAC|nr:uncharacterized protein BDZ83DRAFT_364301 [Colletotrichum acutatum]KAK1723981.1 hypothetical protein BDZ83DRAFT_364301 [Colletotrichum acutatum]